MKTFSMFATMTLYWTRVPSAEIVHVWQQMTRKSMYDRKSFRALRDYYYLQWKHRGLRADPRLREAVA